MTRADFSIKTKMQTSIATIELVERQTEKAILVDVGGRKLWVPKSIINIDDAGVIFAPAWFAKKNGIGFYGYRPALVG